MTDINFVKNIFLDEKGIYAFDSNWHKTRVFLRQGDLDSECVTYCFLMMLILNQKITMNDLFYKHEPKDDLFVNMIRKKFIYNLNGNAKGGTNFKSFNQKLARCNLDIDYKWHTCIYEIKGKTTSKANLDSTIEQYLTKGYPVQISYYNATYDFGHSVVVVGFTQIDPSNLRLYCLDPTNPMPTGQMWNETIDIFYNKDLDYDNKSNSCLIVENALAIIPKAGLFECPF